MSPYLVLDFGGMVHDAWTYKDPAQNGIAQLARDVLDWDLAGFDAWLYSPAHWRGYPRVRQHLMALREQLPHAIGTHAGDPSEQRNDVLDFFRSTRRIALRLESLPPPLRQAITAVDRTRIRRVASDAQIKRLSRIRQEYADRVQSGQKYGAKSELARKYGLSLHTVRKSLNAS